MMRTLLIPLVVSFAATAADRLMAQEDSVLPFVGTDTLLVSDGRGRLERHTGQIEDIKGETLTFRLNGRARTMFIRVTDVAQFHITRSEAWNQGRTLQAEGRLNDALESLDAALQQESRKWAWNEIQANAVVVCIQQGHKRDAIHRIEQILDSDERSRHVSLVPLIWDEQVFEAESGDSVARELGSESEVRRIVAASATLHLPDYQANATLVLRRMQGKSHLPRIRDLAEAQLWRLAYLDTSGRTRALEVWADRVKSIDVDVRHGPMFVLGRCALSQHNYDHAATHFLWTALMSPVDDTLAAQALGEAISCLRQSGRMENVARLTAELQQRFPDSPAAQQAATPPVP